MQTCNSKFYTEIAIKKSSKPAAFGSLLLTKSSQHRAVSVCVCVFLYSIPPIWNKMTCRIVMDCWSLVCVLRTARQKYECPERTDNAFKTIFSGRLSVKVLLQAMHICTALLTQAMLPSSVFVRLETR